jgi:uncharacterized protein YegL
MSVWRRLPIYLLLDCSSSMSGAPIEALRQGVKALLADLRSDPQAVETAHLAVILFDSTARYICPLTELEAFREPEVQARGSSALGAALQLLNQCLEGVGYQVSGIIPTPDTRHPIPNTRHPTSLDWYPLVFIMTDGGPTDNWQEAATTLKQKNLGAIVACATGDTANLAVLQELTGTVLELNGLYPEAFRNYFRWVSDSVKSNPVLPRTRRTPPNLPPPPARVRVVP